MTARLLVRALRREKVERPPVWVMRQAGRYLPEYRELRAGRSFNEAVATPGIAAEITLQPIRRFGMDAAIMFADIMTPLEALGVAMTFNPGPTLEPMSVSEVAALGELDTDRLAFMAETLRLVRAELPDETALIGFAGAPLTLLAYLLEGGGSKEWMALRRAVEEDPAAVTGALSVLARAQHTYLGFQQAAGVDAVQLFDSWVGVLSRGRMASHAIPAARASLAGLEVPTIYFAPHAAHGLDLIPAVGATAYGLDWRMPLIDAWERIGFEHAVQGNLDPAILFAPPDRIRSAVDDLLTAVGDRPGHIVNLGHGISRFTPPEHLGVFIEAVQRR